VSDSPLLLAACALLINLPFGYWRGGCRKYSAPWLAAIHIPVILSIGMRFALGVPLRLATLPLYVLAFAGGQSLGAHCRKWMGSKR
jgi:hypothetical protein